MKLPCRLLWILGACKFIDRVIIKHPHFTVTGRLEPYANSDAIPARTLDQLGHHQLGHYARPTQTLYQLGPHDYNQLGHYSDPVDRLYVDYRQVFSLINNS